MVYSEEEIGILREGGKRLAKILHSVAEKAVSGVTTIELDEYAEKLIEEGGDIPAFLEYKPDGAQTAYPASLCVSVNDEVVHGIPGTRVLQSGDIVGLDLGLSHKGLFVDMAITIPVGDVDVVARKMIDTARGALSSGISAVRSGARVGDIGNAIETFVKKGGFSVVEALGGHGVGKSVHEDPYIPNYGKKNTGEKLKAGQVLALEPMINEGTKDVILGKDGYTFTTRDGKRSAHFEHTILVTENGAEILTKK